ncbi:ArnT family glycosyltransferase [Tautonia rosea]|uniref:ArnT family glycosyltransferase n=1 Tax=Tautonia rosea TaxID=2728037 RepID=UPI00147547C0|nr:glycosyltransferase family 39 protein [Tautonia rosea]
MPRRKPPANPRSRTSTGGSPSPVPSSSMPEAGGSRPILTRSRLILIVGLLLMIQWSLAVISLLGKTPTVDEVVHLPAGVTYWEMGTFRLYPHNPPLIKLIAALPVLQAGPETEPLYREARWGWPDANKAAFAHGFMLLNAPRLFELMAPARLMMPIFAVIGGLVIFDWSRRLWGAWGGLISLTLWTFCPNILAHSQVITTDVGATVIGFSATYAFWHFLKRPNWLFTIVAGLLLGIAQLTKFSLILLYGLWPLLWLVQEVAHGERKGRWRRVSQSVGQGLTMVALSVLVINIGYGFEGTGKKLGDFAFTCKTLTTDRDPPRPLFRNDPTRQGPELKAGVLQFRENRFRGTILESLPVPLPEYYVSGFDDQKLEAEGVPIRAMMFADDWRNASIPPDAISGYPVFLDGELSNESWWYYYLMTLVYKVPEGTWVLMMLTIAVIPMAERSRARAVDESSIWIVPAVVLVVMSFGTNIAIGLRYVLPIFPYLFLGAGRLAPWASGLQRTTRKGAIAVVSAALLATASASLMIHPHYLAYFNWVSGGAKRGSEHLIDSNLDWGQDLNGLHEWLQVNAPGERVGIAYFGQINPEIFNIRAQINDPSIGSARPLDWFLPSVLPGTLPERPEQDAGPPKPGLYAVSTSLMRGLPWRVYAPDRWAPMSARGGAFSYFEPLEPLGHIGYSILLYRIDEADVARMAQRWQSAPVEPGVPPIEPSSD